MENSLQQKPDNFLVWAILSTVLCCLPFGIVAIVFASKVDTLWLSGDTLGAEDAARKARMWTLVSIATGVALMIIYFALCALTAVSLFSALN